MTSVTARCSEDFREEDRGYQTIASQLSVVARVLPPAPWVSEASEHRPSSQCAEVISHSPGRLRDSHLRISVLTPPKECVKLDIKGTKGEGLERCWTAKQILDVPCVEVELLGTSRTWVSASVRTSTRIHEKIPSGRWVVGRAVLSNSTSQHEKLVYR